MEDPDAFEAAGIVIRMLQRLLKTIADKGETGATTRTVIGDTIANAYPLLRSDLIGPSLDNCFDLCQQSGAQFYQLEQIRVWVTIETPQTLGGTLVQNAGIQLCLATEGRVIADMTFVSREGVEAVKSTIQLPFGDAEETAADDMAQMTYQSLISLHAAIINHLVQTALPLPRMLDYSFTAIWPSLVIAYKLYSDAGRGDEVRDENQVIHPAFCPLLGQALSA
jgi:hypothetical protein